MVVAVTQIGRLFVLYCVLGVLGLAITLTPSWHKENTMTQYATASTMILLLGLCFAANATAEDYDYELGLSYDRGSSDRLSTVTGGGGILRNSSDSDTIGLSGLWYYSGLSDANGPKSRAAFLGRASGLYFGYSRGDESGSFSLTGGGIFAPANGSVDGRTNELSAGLRHVWRDSGWYVLGSFSRVEMKSNSVTESVAASSSFDARAYTLGVGKYFGEATALDLQVAQVDTGNSRGTAVALSFTHIGTLGPDWQYGADIGIARSSGRGDEGSYSLRGSLYPSPEFEFGIGYSRQQLDGGFDLDTIEGFVSWFIRDHVELTARYSQDNPDELPGQNIDSDLLGVGVNVRF